ncbi:MAG TPA: EamA family transporter [Actinomycetota bacterium]|nr:EamA family transporter [Actinomycetota bacterium]
MTAATLLVLASVALHVTWNVVVKRGRDPLLAYWAINVFGGLLFAPVVLASAPPARVAPQLCASVALHSAYGLGLVRAYSLADLSVAYPVARGVAPLGAALGAAAFLDESLPPIALAGIALTAAGLAATARGSASARGVAWAVVTGVAIATYTLVDSTAVRAGGHSLGYAAAVVAGQAVVLTPVALARAGARDALADLRAHALAYACGGAGSIGAYALVLAAVRLAPVAYVATLREASVVVAAIAGWRLLAEPFGGRRTAGAAVALTGIALLVAA